MGKFYALISHHELSTRDDFYLKKQLPDKNLSIGWGEVNPIGAPPSKIKEDIKKMYPELGGTNPSNGEKSLSLFCTLEPGDVVFVRGNAKILDIAIITGRAYYVYGNGHDNDYDYCTKIPFTPLFASTTSGISTVEIPEDNYKNILDVGGYTLALRKLDENDVIPLFKKIFELA